MNKILYIFLILITVSNCAPKKVIKHHGVPFLDKKQNNLVVNESNKNDIKKILGKPSTISKFDNDVWIYLERELTQSELLSFGKMKIVKNNILVLEINEYGILTDKVFYDIKSMNEITPIDDVTNIEYKKNTFIYSFMSSMRQKINDPLGTRAKKSKEISQR